MPLSLRQRLDREMTEDEAINDFDDLITHNGEVRCTDYLSDDFPDCKFKITSKDADTGIDSDYLWEHLYSHIRNINREGNEIK